MNNEELMLKKLTEIYSKVNELREQFDAMSIAFVQLDSEVKNIHEAIVTKNEFNGMMNTLDSLALNMKNITDDQSAILTLFKRLEENDKIQSHDIEMLKLKFNPI